jgi:hypothetical protein
VSAWLADEAVNLCHLSFVNIMEYTNGISNLLPTDALFAMPIQKLKEIKKAIRNELKIYDLAFIMQFDRPPKHDEKVPMRKIYVFYKSVKKAIL